MAVPVDPDKVRCLLNQAVFLPPDVHNTMYQEIMKLLEGSTQQEKEEGKKRLQSFIDAGYRHHKKIWRKVRKTEDGNKKQEMIGKAHVLFGVLTDLDELLNPEEEDEEQ